MCFFQKSLEIPKKMGASVQHSQFSYLRLFTIKPELSGRQGEVFFASLQQALKLDYAPEVEEALTGK